MNVLKSILLLFCCLSVYSCGNKQSHENHESNVPKEQKIYTCPMHPEIIRNAPGQCPICGMELVEKSNKGEKQENIELEFLLKPTNSYVISQVKTVNVSERDLPYELTATGTIIYDTKQVNAVSSRVQGRIDKLYAKYRYQTVRKGEKLAAIYSKELETEQQNLLYLLENDAENISLIKAAEQRLMLLGLNQQQIRELKTTGKVSSTITIYSPFTGHLHDIAPENAQVTQNNEMGNVEMSRPAISAQELQLKEGMYVAKGQTIFNIYNTGKVWALLHVYPESQGAIKSGQKIDLEIDGIEDKERHATVSFIEPEMRGSHKGLTIRVSLNNPNDEIKIGAVVTARINSSKKAYYLPSTAVVSLGINKVVFIKENALFKAKRVQTGIQSGDWTEIVGISEADIVAENGQLLMDSEGFIKTQNGSK